MTQAQTIMAAMAGAFLVFITARGSLLTYIRILA